MCSYGVRQTCMVSETDMCSYGVRQTCMVLRRDKECPFSGITNSSSLEEGAKKRFLECDKDLMYVLRKAHIHSTP